MSKFTVTLKKGKEGSILRKHPWVFSGAIRKTSAEIPEGSVVDVLAHDSSFLGRGHWQNGSIAVRILSFTNVKIDNSFWVKAFKKAAATRRMMRLPAATNDVFRLIFGEGDFLPGLVIDWYAGHVVVQAHSIGMFQARHEIAIALQDVFKTQIQTIYCKSGDTLPAGFTDEKNAWLFGDASSAVVTENGNKFEIDWVTGQKTGFFIDQRDNRQLLAQYSKGKKVLNTFSYSGGFSVYALNAGAKLVDSVDCSAKAIKLTDKNMELNADGDYEGKAYTEDTFAFLKENGDDYDIVVVDPPAFAKHRDVRHKAVIGYKRLNMMALKKIKEGGLLFTFSCSQVVDRNLFENTVRSAAIEAGREVSILHYLHQPSDHPVNLCHPEGEYLKGLVLKVGK
ncbi:MAG: class I SAM-dependent rRNA methyltransferase [Lentisphaeraceae bacterium]|nr:class I SAM-dependent rRNA methyltransferase [Lentisphaeraceae bacterium]